MILEANNPSEDGTLKEKSVSHSPAIRQRADALDALRGFAVLAMVLSGVIPRENLPAWMYHAQLPPPTHIFNPKGPGLTWVDLVFPFFLFSMGAAIPLAISRRFAKGWKIGAIVGSILQRGFLLGAFAILLQHVRPTVIDPEPNPEKWWLALWGFCLLFLMFVRWPATWSPWLRYGLTIAAWITGILFISNLQYPKGGGFSLTRSDIILIVLTNMAVFGSLIWLLTRSNPWLRVGLMAFVFAMRLSSRTEGWVKLIWAASPAPWIFQFEYLKYLFIIIPGTIVGDLIGRWIEYSSPEEDNLLHWSTFRCLGITLIMLSINLTLLVGLQARQVEQTTLITLALCLLGWLFLRNPGSITENLLNRLYHWGFYWLILGLLFEPYEGGIKKDSATMSYFFVTTGMAILTLMALIIMIDVFKQKRWLQLFIDNGVNPMIGYMGFANLIWPILVLNNWEPVILEMTSDPLTGFLRGVAYTFILALIVMVFTRFKLFLRT